MAATLLLVLATAASNVQGQQRKVDGTPYWTQRQQCSRHTLQSYTACFRLLMPYATAQANTRRFELKIEHLTGTLLTALFDSLETSSRLKKVHIESP